MKKNSKKKIIIATGFCTVIFMVIIYLCISVFYQYHYLPGTFINGVDCSNKSIEATEEVLLDSVRLYCLKINERYENLEMIPSSDIDMIMSIKDDLTGVKDKQNPYLWFKKGGEHTVDVHITYNESKLDKIISELACLNDNLITGPVAPALNYEGGKFTITGGNVGNEIDKEKTISYIKEAIKNMDETLDLEKKGCYLKELTLDTSVYQQLADKLNSYLGVVITLTFGENTEVIDGSMIHSWLSVDTTNNIVFNEEAIKDYLRTLSAKYDSMGSNRTFTNAEGQTVSLSSGDYGWWLDIATETTNIINDIKNVNTITREPAWAQRADVFGEVDFADTYIEVNLSKQKLYAIKEGELILTADIVSGAPGTSTPVGIYRMRFMFKNYELKRPTLNKTVKYWMVFYGNSVETNIGLCSCDWISKFGGTEYLTNGSLGSIYMSDEDAKFIYENYPNDDFAVIIYKK